MTNNWDLHVCLEDIHALRDEIARHVEGKSLVYFESHGEDKREGLADFSVGLVQDPTTGYVAWCDIPGAGVSMMTLSLDLAEETAMDSLTRAVAKAHFHGAVTVFLLTGIDQGGSAILSKRFGAWVFFRSDEPELSAIERYRFISMSERLVRAACSNFCKQFAPKGMPFIEGGNNARTAKQMLWLAESALGLRNDPCPPE